MEVTESNYDAVNTSLLTRIAAQDAPDVAQVSNQWVATYYEMGGLLPLDEYMSAETLADFYPGTMSGTNIDGHQYSATWITQPFALYCNSDLLAAAGYDHTPTTWDELIEMSYAVAALGKNADGNTVYGRTPVSYTHLDVYKRQSKYAGLHAAIFAPTSSASPRTIRVFKRPETVALRMSSS